jgi:hypothetical protein
MEIMANQYGDYEFTQNAWTFRAEKRVTEATVRSGKGKSNPGNHDSCPIPARFQENVTVTTLRVMELADGRCGVRDRYV